MIDGSTGSSVCGKRRERIYLLLTETAVAKELIKSNSVKLHYIATKKLTKSEIILECFKIKDFDFKQYLTFPVKILCVFIFANGINY